MSPWWRRRRADAPVEEETLVIDDRPRAAGEEVVEEAPHPPPPPRIWPWLLALVLLVLAGALAYWLLTRDDERTTMPRVVGLTEAQARTRISEAELDADVDRRRSDRRAGLVFAQTPGAGTQLEEGERVEISVSSGRRLVPVPAVRELPEEEAVEKVEGAGFRTRIQRVFAGAPERTVVEQEPRGGERAPQESIVVLKISRGRNLNEVPDVVGRTEREAVRILRAGEFEPRIFDVPAPDPRGTVVAQQPQGGEQAPPDSRVRINVSTGESEGQPQERPSTIRVPEVVGLAQTAALRRLLGAQLDGLVRYQASDEPLARVLAQRPAAGASARSGGEVIVTVSAGRDPERATVPDVVGETEEAAREMLEAEGFRVETIATRTDETSPGEVIDQQPRAGTRAPLDAVVTLYVAEAG